MLFEAEGGFEEWYITCPSQYIYHSMPERCSSRSDYKKLPKYWMSVSLCDMGKVGTCLSGHCFIYYCSMWGLVLGFGVVTPPHTCTYNHSCVRPSRTPGFRVGYLSFRRRLSLFNNQLSTSWACCLFKFSEIILPTSACRVWWHS
jgi:hypothetical protein